jgi:hypothetical protein
VVDDIQAVIPTAGFPQAQSAMPVAPRAT